MHSSQPRVLLMAVLAAASPALAGPEWEEPLDSCGMIECAQSPIGTGPLAGIKGELTGSMAREDGDFEDLFRIYIADPVNFSIFVSPNQDGTPSFDTQLWLFDRAGDGLLGNDDNHDTGMSGKSGFGNATTDGTGVMITQPGVYFLGISGAGNTPRNDSGARIFDLAVPGEVSGPDGVIGSSARLNGWTGMGDTGSYTLQLTGVTFLPPNERADINNDGCVDSDDLARLLAGWGSGGQSDLNSDGITNSQDLAVLLAAWGCKEAKRF